LCSCVLPDDLGRHLLLLQRGLQLLRFLLPPLARHMLCCRFLSGSWAPETAANRYPTSPLDNEALLRSPWRSRSVEQSDSLSILACLAWRKFSKATGTEGDKIWFFFLPRVTKVDPFMRCLYSGDGLHLTTDLAINPIESDVSYNPTWREFASLYIQLWWDISRPSEHVEEESCEAGGQRRG
jgi:hypothetical protein